nr:LacI family DNA-binding transcriptional regulator [Periweissella beninensis]
MGNEIRYNRFIHKKIIKVGEKLVSNKEKLTINDIARLAGVSKSTVSRYLNNGPISSFKKAKIAEVIEKTDYQPNVFAQSIRQNQSALVGVLVPRLNSTVMTDLLKGIDQYDERTQLLIVNTYQKDQRVISALKTMAQQNVSGIIYSAARLSSELKATLDEVPMPVVIYGQDSPTYSHVVMDDYEAGFKMGQFVGSKTPKNTLLLTINPQVDEAVGKLRYEGFKLGFTQANNHQVLTEETTTFAQADAKEATLVAFKKKQYDFIVAITDTIAAGALSALHELNLRVPDDVQVVGFGGTSLANLVTPALTTIKFPYQEAGAMVMNLLQKVIHKELSAVHEIKLKSELHLGESTKQLDS